MYLLTETGLIMRKAEQTLALQYLMSETAFDMGCV